MVTIAELETRIDSLQEQVAQALEIASRHGDEHFAEGSDPATSFFTEVATANDLPATRPASTLYKVKGPPVLLYMVDPDGQRELGFSVLAVCDSSLTLGTSNADVSGCSVTLPKPGAHIITANVTYLLSAAALGSTGAMEAFCVLTNSSDTEQDSGRAAKGQWNDPFNILTLEGVTEFSASQTWRISTTTDDEVFKLRARRTAPGSTVTLQVTAVDTTLTASTFLGGNTTSSSHTHTHAQATSQTEGDHHAAFIGLKGDGSPVDPDGTNRINLIGGTNITLTPTVNDITIDSSGGGGSGPHILTDALVHTDMEPDQLILTGDMIVRNAASQWNRLRVGPTVSHILHGGTVPSWITLTQLLGLESHGTLQGLIANDHPQYARQASTEVISGEWTWENFVEYVVGSAPGNPAEDHLRVRLITDGSNLILRGYGPTGATCDICTVSNVVVAHTNTLAQNWVE